MNSSCETSKLQAQRSLFNIFHRFVFLAKHSNPAATMSSSITTVDDALISKATAYAKDYMSHYDPSHDFNHILRVLHLARQIHAHEATPSCSLPIVTLCALLHDVGDKKYLKPGEDATTLIHDVLISLGADHALATKVQTVCLAVSYSSEVKNPDSVKRVLAGHPELAVVQDADRLDAIGAVGIGRTFTFGGAKNQTMEKTMAHFEEKLVRLQGMMKTEIGRTMARERTERLKMMQRWWADETAAINGLN